jgi:hypothetical protein
MKNKFLIIILASSMGLFYACNGDHSTRVVRDTNANRYGTTDTAKTAKSNIDTSKVTTTTGDASTIDNSGSGGTQTAKDTSKKKAKTKK